MRKGASGIDMLGVLAIGFVVAAVTVSIGSKVLADVQATMPAGAAQYATGNGTLALGNISANMPLLGTIGVLVLVVSFILLLRGAPNQG